MMRLAGGEAGEHECGRPGADCHDSGGLGVARPVYGRRRPLCRGRLRPLALAGDDVDVDVAALAHEVVDHRAEQELSPAGARRLPEDDPGDVPAARVGEDLRGDVVPRQSGRLRAELLGQAEGLDDAVPVRVREAGGGWRLHVDDHPLGPQSGGHPPSSPHDARGEGTRADADQDALGHGPHAGDGMVAAVHLHLGVHPRRGGPERQLPERDQVAFPEEAPDGFTGLLGKVDLPVLQALDQVVGGQIDQLDLGRLFQDRVRDRLARGHLGHARDDVVQALEMLDVQRRVDVDPGGEQLLDVLPALGVTGAGGVGVGQLVDEDEGRAAGEGRVEVELAERGAAVLDRARRQPLEPGEERLRLGPAVRLDPADDHVDARGLLSARGLQHGVGLADAGGRSEEDLELPATLARLLLPDPGQERVRIGAVVVHACSLADEVSCGSRVVGAAGGPLLSPSAPRAFPVR